MTNGFLETLDRGAKQELDRAKAQLDARLLALKETKNKLLLIIINILAAAEAEGKQFGSDGVDAFLGDDHGFVNFFNKLDYLVGLVEDNKLLEEGELKVSLELALGDYARLKIPDSPLMDTFVLTNACLWTRRWTPWFPQKRITTSPTPTSSCSATRLRFL